MSDHIGTATYSPDDNKLRLSAFSRLSPELYARVKAAGFSWAPRQEIFVAPRWTTSREDLLIELCGEIGDEDGSLLDRAEVRAERFEGYKERRTADAESAHAGAARIMEGIPMGQPILIGHHSEKHARKDAQRIENGLRKAVKMWETASYWQDRAAGAIAHAKYKELPAVRARRIKGIETDLRRMEREDKERAAKLALWSKEGITLEQARQIANYANPGVTPNTTGGHWTAWDVLRPDDDRYKSCPSWTVEQVRAVALRVYSGSSETRERWRAHYANRIAYERAMLAEQGATALLDKKPRATLAPILNYRAPSGFIEHRMYGKTQRDQQFEMTKAEYAKVNDSYRGARRSADKSHRYRVAAAGFVPSAKAAGITGYAFVAVFLTDSKSHPVPATVTPPETPAPLPPPPTIPRPVREIAPDPAAAARAALKAGVVVTVAPQLFPTPPDLARRMVQEAGMMAGRRILEPSAGTGNLIRAILNDATGADCCKVVAVEINGQLAQGLRTMRDKTAYANETRLQIHARDFLECDEELLGQFDFALMNPPFKDGSDIKHIEHARRFLKPGGRLVAICANGPRQRAALMPIVEETGGTWEDLPAGTFKEAGTNVNTALVVIEAARLAA